VRSYFIGQSRSDFFPGKKSEKKNAQRPVTIMGGDVHFMDMFMFHVSLQPSTASNNCQACNAYYRNIIIIKPYKMIHSGIFILITFYSLLILRAFLSVSLLILFSLLCQWLKLFSYL
jgi:hypothetical protein